MGDMIRVMFQKKHSGYLENGVEEDENGRRSVRGC